MIRPTKTLWLYCNTHPLDDPHSTIFFYIHRAGSTNGCHLCDSADHPFTAQYTSSSTNAVCMPMEIYIYMAILSIQVKL